MTFAWLLIDVKGRRWLLLTGAFWLAISFAILSVLGGLAYNSGPSLPLSIPLLATGIPGILVLYLATAVFGICWLVPPWVRSSLQTRIGKDSKVAQVGTVSQERPGLLSSAPPESSTSFLNPPFFSIAFHLLRLSPPSPIQLLLTASFNQSSSPPKSTPPPPAPKAPPSASSSGALRTSPSHF